MSTSVSLRKRRSVASRPITNRPQTITGQQNKALNEEQERERQARELDARRRRARRRLDELERINYRDAPSASSTTAASSSLEATSSSAAETAIAGAREVESGSAAVGVSLAQRRRNQAEIKRILVGGRRNLHSIVEELMDQGRLPLRVRKAGANWTSARSGPAEKPGRRYCSICGYHGDLTCVRCPHRYCSGKCRDVHDETRCERPLR